MAALLTTLKVIGIILLSLIALVLILACIILFVPVRYRIRGKKGEAGDDIRAKIQASFLLHILSAAFIYDKETDLYVKLFGIRIYPRKKKEEEETVNTPEPDGAEAVFESGQEPAAGEADPGGGQETAAGGEEPEADQEDTPVMMQQDTEKEDDTADVGKASEDDTGRADEKDLWDKAEDLILKVADKIGKAADKTEGIRKKISYWKRFAEDKRNKRAFEHIRDVAVKLLKKIAPRKVKGLIHFGSDDPATTGKILSYLGILYPVLPRKLLIEPDFEESLIYGEVDIKGHFGLIVFAVALLKLVLDKDCRRMWNIYKKHKADNT